MTIDAHMYELDYGEISTTTVKFSLSGENLIPTDVSSLLGIESSKSWRKGERIPRDEASTFVPRQPYPFGRWLLNAPCTRYEGYQEQLTKLLDILEELPSALIPLIEKYSGEIIIAFSSEDETAGFHFNPDVIRRIHHLGVSFDVTVYLG